MIKELAICEKIEAKFDSRGGSALNMGNVSLE
jgi:hypothetical protein